MQKRGIEITYRLGRGESVKVPVRRAPSEKEDLAAFVTRIARHAGITWDTATVKFPDGVRKEVRPDVGRN